MDITSIPEITLNLKTKLDWSPIIVGLISAMGILFSGYLSTRIFVNQERRRVDQNRIEIVDQKLINYLEQLLMLEKQDPKIGYYASLMSSIAPPNSKSLKDFDKLLFENVPNTDKEFEAWKARIVAKISKYYDEAYIKAVE